MARLFDYNCEAIWTYLENNSENARRFLPEVSLYIDILYHIYFKVIMRFLKEHFYAALFVFAGLIKIILRILQKCIRSAEVFLKHYFDFAFYFTLGER